MMVHCDVSHLSLDLPLFHYWLVSLVFCRFATHHVTPHDIESPLPMLQVSSKTTAMEERLIKLWWLLLVDHSPWTLASWHTHLIQNNPTSCHTNWEGHPLTRKVRRQHHNRVILQVLPNLALISYPPLSSHRHFDVIRNVSKRFSQTPKFDMRLLWLVMRLWRVC
jgi:hypothetical protein